MKNIEIVNFTLKDESLWCKTNPFMKDEDGSPLTIKSVMKNKVVVFDLDDTIGHFVQLSGLDWFLTKLYGKVIKREHFNEILDLYPEVFRPRIFEIMTFLKNSGLHTNLEIMIL